MRYGGVYGGVIPVWYQVQVLYVPESTGTGTMEVRRERISAECVEVQQSVDEFGSGIRWDNTRTRGEEVWFGYYGTRAGRN